MSRRNRVLDAGRLLLDLVTRDPSFVRGGHPRLGEIPVFTFHSLEPQSFERKMHFLIEAGYQAIGMVAYLDALRGLHPAPAKSVLITIDDGRATTWTVGYPTLKRLGMRATAFLVSSAVHDSDEVSKTIADVRESDRTPLMSRDESADRPFVTWGEVRAMRDVIDIESHTHLHARIPVGEEPSGVVTAAMGSGYGEFDCPFVPHGGHTVRGGALPLGRALPASAPRLSGRPAFLAAAGRYETAAETSEALRFDLGEARRLIREKTGAEATTVCYPWHVYSEAAKRIAREEGYVAGFAGKAASGPAVSGPDADPFEIARIGEDYVERLPGPGRRSILSILLEKQRRRG